MVVAAGVGVGTGAGLVHAKVRRHGGAEARREGGGEGVSVGLHPLRTFTDPPHQPQKHACRSAAIAVAPRLNPRL